MADKLRMVLVGCGQITNAWLKTPTVQQEIDIVGLVDLRDEATAALAERHGLSNAVCGTSLANVLQQTSPEVVFDCTVPEAHTDVTLTALEHGCHVVGEKPMATDMERAARMVDAAQKAGKVYAVTQSHRFSIGLRRFGAFLHSGALGRIHALHADFYISAHFGGFREVMEHVLLLDMAIHHFDQARDLSRQDGIDVIAHEWNPPGSWYRHGAAATALFRMTGDVVFNYRGNWASTGMQTPWTCVWRAEGSRGTALWRGGDDITAQRVRDPDQSAAREGGSLIRELEDVAVPDVDRDMRVGHDAILAAAVDAIRNGGTPETHAADNIKSLAMVHAAVNSARTEERCVVEEVMRNGE
jgi:predicted dehydrogenase